MQFMEKSKQKKPIICLIQPKRQFTQDFSILRNHLRKWRIPFQQQFGLKNLSKLFSDQKYHYIGVVNSREITDTLQIQKISKREGIQIYFYPLKNAKFKTLCSPSQLVDIYQKKGIGSHKSKQKMRLLNIRSISKQHKQHYQQKKHKQSKDLSNKYKYNPKYQKIVVYAEQNNSELLNCLAALLKQQQQIVYNQGRVNELLGLGRQTKNNLIITQIKHYKQIKRPLLEQNIMNNFDFIIVGINKSKSNRDQRIILITNDLRNILQVIDESGFSIEKAIDKYIQEDRKIRMMRELGNGTNFNQDHILENDYKNKFMPQTVIHQLSDQYRGSNRDSYLIEEDQYGYSSKKKQQKASSQLRYKQLSSGSGQKKQQISLSNINGHQLSEGKLKQAKINDKNRTRNEQQITVHNYSDSKYRIKTIQEKSLSDSSEYNDDNKKPQKQDVQVKKQDIIDQNQVKPIEQKQVNIKKSKIKKIQNKKQTISQLSKKQIPQKTVQSQQIIQQSSQNRRQNVNYLPEYKIYRNTNQKPSYYNTPQKHKQYTSSVPKYTQPIQIPQILKDSTIIQTPSIYSPPNHSNYQNKLSKRQYQYAGSHKTIQSLRSTSNVNSARILSSNNIDLSKYQRIQQNGRVIYRPKQLINKKYQAQTKQQTIQSYSQSKQRQQQKVQIDQVIAPKLVESQYYRPTIGSRTQVQQSNKIAKNYQTQHNPYRYEQVKKIEIENKKDEKIKNSHFKQKQKIQIVNSQLPYTGQRNHEKLQKGNTNHRKLQYNHRNQEPPSNQKINIVKQLSKTVKQNNIHSTPGISTHNQFSSANNSNLGSQQLYKNKKTFTYNNQKEEVRNSSSSYYTQDRKLYKQSSAIRQSSDFSALDYYHDNQGQLYNSYKPFHNSIITKIQTEEQYNKIDKQFSSLSLDPNCFHYLIENSHPYLSFIQDYSSFRDKIEIAPKIKQIQSKVSNRSLPNHTYDLGFIYISNIRQFNRENHRPGYFFIDIDPHYRQVDISKSKNQIKLSKPQNIRLAQKLLLAPIIQHYVFYHKDDRDASKIIKLFPAAIFHKSYYSNYNDLIEKIENHGNIRKNNRLKRVIILANQKNISEISKLSGYETNVGNFDIFCNVSDGKNIEKLTQNLPKVKFINNYQFSSYGSVIKYSPDKNDQQTNKQIAIQSKNTQLFLDIKHKQSIPQNLIKYLSEKYELIYFQNLEQIPTNKYNATILMHGLSNYIGKQFNTRNFQAVYLVGDTRTRMLPGVVRIDYQDINQLL